MMKFFPILLMFAAFGAAYSQEATNAPAAPDTNDRRGEILLPDVKLSIEDESEVPLQAQTNAVLDDEKLDVGGRTDLSELTKTHGSEKYLLDIGNEEQKKDQFSLSTFNIWYGMFDNLDTELTVGKRAGNVNYLLSYDRNRCGDAGIMGSNWNSFYNTEISSDNLSADLIYFLSNNVELDASLGYQDFERGLFTNRFNTTESREYVPVKVSASCNFDVFYSLKGELSYQYLDFQHKLADSYDTHNLNDVTATGTFDASWGRNNFLKVVGDYLFSYYDTNAEHTGHLGALDRFFILPSLDMELGGDIYATTVTSFFWYPTASLYYKYQNILNLQLGMTGSRDALNINRWNETEQTEFSPGLPTESWRFLMTLAFTPVRYFTLRGGVFYDIQYHYASTVYDSSTDLYAFQDMTNLNMVSAETKLDFLPLDNTTNTLMITASYRYRMPDRQGLLFLPQNTASAMLSYRQNQVGFEFQTSFSYSDIMLTSPGVWEQVKLLWDAGVTQSLNKDIYLEFQVRNILNQNYFERPGIPTGGISVNGGVKFLL
jgi:hypothetical protein